MIEVPRLKHVHTAHRDNGRTIRIGAAYGVGVEIDDPDGLVWALIEAMDGTHTTHEIALAVRRRYPQHAVADLEGAVGQLVGTGFFTDASATVTVPPEDRERYSRSVAYYAHVDRTPRRSEWEVLSRIAAAHVTVVGVGGLGSACAYALAASGIGRLTLIDPDHVELSNLSRQVLYTHADVGRSKAVTAAARLTAVRPALPVEVQAQALRSESDFVEVFRGCDLVVLAADSPVEIEERCNRAALDTGKPWVHGGYDGPHVMSTLYVPGAGPCWWCLRLTHFAEQPRPSHGPGRRVHQATAATSNIAGNLTAHAALAHITGVAPPPPGEPAVWSTVRMGHAFTVPVEQRSDCAECGHPA